MTYVPKPIDTAAVALTPDLLELTEQLAEHVHDTWAQLRLAQHWTHAPARDDDAKTHPCLVPYDQLPESEKEADRQTALNTLKAILALGYRISGPAPEAKQ
jgi:RyR domain